MSMPRLLLLPLLLLAFTQAPAVEPGADAPVKKPRSRHDVGGGLSLVLSTDRNAGLAPLTDGATRNLDDDETDEEDDEDDDFDAFNDDFFDDLDLSDQDAIDQLDESIDEDGDGDFFDEDGAGQDEEGDVDGDGILDGSEVLGDDDGDGVPDALDALDELSDPALADARRAAARPGRSVRDERLTYNANLNYAYRTDGLVRKWKIGGRLASTDFDRLGGKDTQLYGFKAGPVFKLKSLRATIQPSFVYAALRKDGADVFDTYGLVLNTGFKLTKQWKLSLQYGYDVRSFDNGRVADVDTHGFGAGLEYRWSKRQRVELGYRNRLEDTSFAALARTKDQHQVTLAYALKWRRFFFKPQVGYAIAERDAASRPGLPVREDERVTYGFALGAKLPQGFSAEVQYGNTELDVNLPRKDSSNDRVAAVVAWKF